MERRLRFPGVTIVLLAVVDVVVVVVVVVVICRGVLPGRKVYRFGFFERLYGHHIGLMYFGLFVFRLQVLVCQVSFCCLVLSYCLPSLLS